MSASIAEREQAMAAAAAIARRSGSSFLPALLLLPRGRREAMLIVYAWCRRSDDIADGDLGPAEKRQALADWRADLDRAFRGDTALIRDPTALALCQVLERFAIPRELFEELLAGVESDLARTRYPTFAELRGYAYRVASVVGLMSLEVLGARSEAAREYAVDLGLALQLTNIVRDVASDLERNRIYLPLEDFARHGVDPEDLVARRDSPALRRVVAETAARARQHFERARREFPEDERRALFPAVAMAEVYRRLLDRIERSGFALFGPRVRVPRPVKAWIAAREYLRARGPFSVAGARR